MQVEKWDIQSDSSLRNDQRPLFSPEYGKQYHSVDSSSTAPRQGCSSDESNRLRSFDIYYDESARRVHVAKLACFALLWLLSFLAGPLMLNFVYIRTPGESLAFINFLFIVILVTNFSGSLSQFPAIIAFLDHLRPAIYTTMEPVHNKDCLLSAASVICREKCFHLARNFMGVTLQWHELHALVCGDGDADGEDSETASLCLPYRSVMYRHYIIDNSGAAGCVPLFVQRLARLLATREGFLAARLMFAGLIDCPVEPTEQEYNILFSEELRGLIDNFLLAIPAQYYAVFNPVPGRTREALMKKRKKPSSVDLDDTSSHNHNNAKCCLDGCDYTRSEFPFRVGHVDVVIVVLSAMTDDARSKGVSLNHLSRVINKTRFEGEGRDQFNDSKFTAIIDARHMMGPHFWEKSLSKFFHEKQEITSLRFVQVMRFYPSTFKEEDYYDRGNHATELIAESFLNEVSSALSFGTNCLWSLRDFRDGSGPFLFPQQTLIEDNEASFYTFDHQEDSYQISEKLSFGCVKSLLDYCEAPSRWAAGTYQLILLQIQKDPLYLIKTILLQFTLPVMYSLLLTFLDGALLIIAAIDICIIAFLFVIVPTFRLTPMLKKFYRDFVLKSDLFYYTKYVIMGVINLMVTSYLCFGNQGTRELLPAFNIPVALCGVLVITLNSWVMTSITKTFSTERSKEIDLWRAAQFAAAFWPVYLAGIPRIFSSNTAWAISSKQALFVLIFNSLQCSLYLSGLIYSLYVIHVESRFDFSLHYVNFQLLGALASFFALLFILPPTATLLMNFLGKRDSRPIRLSGRHFAVIALFFIVFLMVYHGINWDFSLSLLVTKFCLPTTDLYYPNTTTPINYTFFFY